MMWRREKSLSNVLEASLRGSSTETRAQSIHPKYEEERRQHIWAQMQGGGWMWQK